MQEMQPCEIIERLSAKAAYQDVLLWLEQTRVPSDLKSCSIWDDLAKYIDSKIETL